MKATKKLTANLTATRLSFSGQNVREWNCCVDDDIGLRVSRFTLSLKLHFLRPTRARKLQPLVTTERQARVMLERVTYLRQLISELECDCSEWQCDVEIRVAFARMKTQLDDATLALSMFQPMRKH